MNKVVKVFAPWCAPCSQYEPKFQEAENKIGFMYPEITWERWNADVVDASKHGVSVIPATLFFHDDVLLGMKVGVIETEQLISDVVRYMEEAGEEEVVYGSN